MKKMRPVSFETYAAFIIMRLKNILLDELGVHLHLISPYLQKFDIFWGTYMNPEQNLKGIIDCCFCMTTFALFDEF